MKEQNEPLRFLTSPRGQFIVSQALYLAIQSINSRPEIEQEPSNVADMQYLLDTMFPIFQEIERARDNLKLNNNQGQ